MRSRALVALLWLLFASVGVAAARGVLEGEDCLVERSEIIRGNLFVLCRTLTIDGRVEGDVLGGAGEVFINGSVTGSLYLLGVRADVSGSIGGDIHFAGVTLHVTRDATIGSRSADLYSLSLNTLLEAEHFAGSVSAIGYQLRVRSQIEREISFWGSALEIDAPVGGNVYATVGNPESTGVAELSTLVTPLEVELVNPGLRVGENGVISGQLTYVGPVEGEIAGRLASPPIFIPVVTNELVNLQEIDFFDSLNTYLQQATREFLTIGLVGLVAIVLAQRPMQAPLKMLRLRPLPSLGMGLLAFILSFPIFLIILLFSVLLLGVISLLRLADLTAVSALILGVLNFSGIGLFYFVAIFISRVVICLATGRVLLRMLLGERGTFRDLVLSLLLGAAVLAALASLPLIGWLINALAAFFGLGAIMTLLQSQLDRAREGAPVESPAAPSPRPVVALSESLDDEVAALELQALPPPEENHPPSAPGMDNLPEGFNWWQ